jgi:hypothetical protein
MDTNPRQEILDRLLPCICRLAECMDKLISLLAQTVAEVDRLNGRIAELEATP